MDDCSVWTHTGNGWETETNKIFLLAEKYTKSISKVTKFSKAQRLRKREGEGVREKKEQRGLEKDLSCVVHPCVQQREL